MSHAYWAFCPQCQRWYYPTADEDRRDLACPVCLVPPIHLAVDQPPLQAEATPAGATPADEPLAEEAS